MALEIRRTRELDLTSSCREGSTESVITFMDDMSQAVAEVLQFPEAQSPEVRQSLSTLSTQLAEHLQLPAPVEAEPDQPPSDDELLSEEKLQQMDIMLLRRARDVLEVRELGVYLRPRSHDALEQAIADGLTRIVAGKESGKNNVQQLHLAYLHALLMNELGAEEISATDSRNGYAQTVSDVSRARLIDISRPYFIREPIRGYRGAVKNGKIMRAVKRGNLNPEWFALKPGGYDEALAELRKIGVQGIEPISELAAQLQLDHAEAVARLKTPLPDLEDSQTAEPNAAETNPAEQDPAEQDPAEAGLPEGEQQAQKAGDEDDREHEGDQAEGDPADRQP